MSSNAIALSLFFKTDIQNIKKLDEKTYNFYQYQYDNKTYISVIEDELISYGIEYFDNMVCYLNSTFLANCIEMPYLEDLISVAQKQDYKSNDAIKKLIERTCGMEKIVSDLIDIDGYSVLGLENNIGEIEYNNENYIIFLIE